jgi:hypothetical protein
MQGGALVPYGTRAPKELLHHLPTLILRRPSESARPTWLLSGVRGSRLLDRRPPRYRCPAVPGLKASARAILMARVPPFFLADRTAAYPVRASAARRLHRGTASASTAVLLAAAPDHCGPPGPVVSPVAVLQQPWLRNSTTEPPCLLLLRYCCPAVHPCRALLSLWATRETIATALPNVYSRRHRFSCARRGANRPLVVATVDANGGRRPVPETGLGDRHRAGQGGR